ncbi:hypothetical protein M422DRAFT_53149 [Sphaerobolus stellatus SS14]|uniref:Uncharacterized protein n=1 Tax=Sphaerobolus stellatus (strain SS14) TaxID=990650 RepID=A0A0C9URW9_SPHS4|nr:hypothetical protein M422DRAFT_53149 [Sphaerobolus stellatus SS14]
MTLPSRCLSRCLSRSLLSTLPSFWGLTLSRCLSGCHSPGVTLDSGCHTHDSSLPVPLPVPLPLSPLNAAFPLGSHPLPVSLWVSLPRCHSHCSPIVTMGVSGYSTYRETCKHPITGNVIKGFLIDRRRLEEHQRQDAVRGILISNSPELSTEALEAEREEQRREERHRAEQELILANLQAKFTTLSIGEENIPYSFSIPSVLREPPQGISIPEPLMQKLESIDLQAALLLGESMTIRSMIIEGIRKDPTVQCFQPANKWLEKSPLFPGESIITRLRNMYNALNAFHIEASDPADKIRDGIQRNILNELELLLLQEKAWNTHSSSWTASPVQPMPDNLIYYNTEHFFHKPMANVDPLLVFAVFCIVLVNIFSHVAHNTCNFIMQFMKAMVRTALARNQEASIPPHQQ